MPDYDPVNHPAHYTEHPSGVECIQIAQHYPFNLGNVIKYIWRAGLKDGIDDLEDLKKARFYLNQEIELRRKSRESAARRRTPKPNTESRLAEQEVSEESHWGRRWYPGPESATVT